MTKIAHFDYDGFEYTVNGSVYDTGYPVKIDDDLVEFSAWLDTVEPYAQIVSKVSFQEVPKYYDIRDILISKKVKS